MKKERLPALALLAVALLAPVLFGGDGYVMGLVVSALVIGCLATAWALLGNLGGMVSFGHSAFFGVGAYVSALTSLDGRLPVGVGLLLGGVGGFVAAVLALPVLRLRGPYFALSLLAFAHILKTLATEAVSITGGAAGVPGVRPFSTFLGIDFGGRVGSHLLIVAIAVVFVAVYWRIRASDWGLVLRAMHDSEDATRVVGADSMRLKALMLLLSGFMTGIVGAFNAHFVGLVEPDYAFGAMWVTLPIVAAVFGGYRTVVGPIVGALVIYLVDQLFLKNVLPSGHQSVLGALLVAVIIFGPDGVVGLLVRRRATDAAH